MGVVVVVLEVEVAFVIYLVLSMIKSIPYEALSTYLSFILSFSRISDMTLLCV